MQKCRPARGKTNHSHLLLQVNDSSPLSVASTVDDATRSVSVTRMKDLGSCVLSYRIASCNCVGFETIPLSRAQHAAFHSVFMFDLWVIARPINNHLWTGRPGLDSRRGISFSLAVTRQHCWYNHSTQSTAEVMNEPIPLLPHTSSWSGAYFNDAFSGAQVT